MAEIEDAIGDVLIRRMVSSGRRAKWKGPGYDYYVELEAKSLEEIVSEIAQAVRKQGAL